MFDERQLEEFLRDCWMRRHFLAHLDEAEFRALKEELAELDPITLISQHKDEVVSVWFEDMQGRTQAVDLSPPDALKFYEAGMTIFLPNVSTPTINRWQIQMAHSLARPPRNFLSSLFISREGNVSACHFDHLESFTIQLSGTKTWKLMENRQVPLPTVNYSANTLRPHQEELWLYAEKPLPKKVSDDAERVTVTPGSILYVPRGYWHEVEAAADSISLLLAFPVYTWLDLVLPSLRTILLPRLEWRENVIYPHDAQSWQMAHQRLRHLCQQLAGFLQELDPTEFLPVASDGTDGRVRNNAVFRRNQLCTLGIYEAGNDLIDLVASVHQGQLSRTREAQVPASWRPALEMVERNREITEAVLAEKYVELAAYLPQMLELLVTLELIRPEETGKAAQA
jgi:50S ribosomal protein L16 3-hydroxylase